MPKLPLAENNSTSQSTFTGDTLDKSGLQQLPDIKSNAKMPQFAPPPLSEDSTQDSATWQHIHRLADQSPRSEYRKGIAIFRRFLVPS